jgi:hypothetical protein
MVVSNIEIAASRQCVHTLDAFLIDWPVEAPAQAFRRLLPRSACTTLRWGMLDL